MTSESIEQISSWNATQNHGTAFINKVLPRANQTNIASNTAPTFPENIQSEIFLPGPLMNKIPSAIPTAPAIRKALQCPWLR